MKKQTVAPVFGIIKNVLGFRGFSLRGLKNVPTEFDLVKNAYNIKRLFNLSKLLRPYGRSISPVQALLVLCHFLLKMIQEATTSHSLTAGVLRWNNKNSKGCKCIISIANYWKLYLIVNFKVFNWANIRKSIKKLVSFDSNN